MATAASAPSPSAASLPASATPRIGDSEFDRDTAVTRREPGVYDTELSAGWTIINAVNGGYLLAVLGRALADALPHADPFTISAHYLTASAPGPAVIRTDVVRAGRTLSTGQASLFQYDEEGREVERIRVLASYGDLDVLPDDVRTTAEPPAIPPLDQCFGAQDAPDHRPVPGSSAIADRLFLKLDPATLGWALGQPSGKGEMRAWFASRTASTPTRCRCCSRWTRCRRPPSRWGSPAGCPPWNSRCTSATAPPPARCASRSPRGTSRAASWRRTRRSGTARTAWWPSPASSRGPG